MQAIVVAVAFQLGTNTLTQCQTHLIRMLHGFKLGKALILVKWQCIWMKLISLIVLCVYGERLDELHGICSTRHHSQIGSLDQQVAVKVWVQTTFQLSANSNRYPHAAIHHTCQSDSAREFALPLSLSLLATWVTRSKHRSLECYSSMFTYAKVRKVDLIHKRPMSTNSSITDPCRISLWSIFLDRKLTDVHVRRSYFWQFRKLLNFTLFKKLLLDMQPGKRKLTSMCLRVVLQNRIKSPSRLIVNQTSLSPPKNVEQQQGPNAVTVHTTETYHCLSQTSKLSHVHN